MPHITKVHITGLVAIAVLVSLGFLAALTHRVIPRHARFVVEGWVLNRSGLLSGRLGWTNFGNWCFTRERYAFERTLRSALQSRRAKGIPCVLAPGSYTALAKQARSRGIYFLGALFRDASHVTLYVWAEDVEQVQELLKAMGSNAGQSANGTNPQRAASEPPGPSRGAETERR